MKAPLRLLILEDQPDDADLLVRHLVVSGFNVQSERVDNRSAMARALERQTWDVVIADYNMPSFGVSEAMSLISERKVDIPFIILSGSIGEETAAAAMKAGAHDYITKGHLSRLVPAIERELREAESRRLRRRAEERIVYLAYHDLLTGLANRNQLVERITQGLMGPGSLTLFLIELNRFRDIVNTLGHHHGDYLLIEVSKRLRQSVENSSLVAHIEGEKFAILLPSSQRSEAVALGDRLRAAFGEAIQADNLTLDVDVSVGIALSGKDDKDAAELIRRAEVALSIARLQDEPKVYEPADDPYSARRLELISDLRRALDADQLSLMFQPKVDLRTLDSPGVEALVRWRHPRLGMIPPNEFIPLAERTGLIGALTLWVLNCALEHQRQWTASGLDLSVAVNLSARNMHDLRLTDRVAASLAKHDVRAERLELEITESTLMDDPARAKVNLLALRAMGVRMSIDDFGTGYSSLSYLRTLPVDALKIDKSFIGGSLDLQHDTTLVKSAIELGHNLGLKVIAEGVENRRTLDRLIALQCDAAQGYFFARPMADADLRQWLRRGAASVMQGAPAGARA